MSSCDSLARKRSFQDKDIDEIFVMILQDGDFLPCGGVEYRNRPITESLQRESSFDPRSTPRAWHPRVLFECGEENSLPVLESQIFIPSCSDPPVAKFDVSGEKATSRDYSKILLRLSWTSCSIGLKGKCYKQSKIDKC